MEIFHRDAGVTLLEICTSDTHITAAKAHNVKGYLALGDVTTPETFSKLLVELFDRAKSRVSSGTYETSVVCHFSKDHREPSSRQLFRSNGRNHIHRKEGSAGPGNPGGSDNFGRRTSVTSIYEYVVPWRHR